MWISYCWRCPQVLHTVIELFDISLSSYKLVKWILCSSFPPSEPASSFSVNFSAMWMYFNLEQKDSDIVFFYFLQESPSAWTQEAYRPPCSKCSLWCCVSWQGREGCPIHSWTGRIPHPVLDGEIPHPVLDGGTHPVLDGRGVLLPRSR